MASNTSKEDYRLQLPAGQAVEVDRMLGPVNRSVGVAAILRWWAGLPGVVRLWSLGSLPADVEIDAAMMLLERLADHAARVGDAAQAERARSIVLLLQPPTPDTESAQPKRVRKRPEAG